MSGFLGGILDAIGINTTPRGMLDAPVGTSTMQRVTNPSPDFSPMISPGLLSNEQRLGAFWNLATRRAKPYTNADLPALAASGQEAVDSALGWAGMTTPLGRADGAAINAALAQKFPDVQFYVSAPKNGQRLVLDKVVVPPDKRNQGVGSAFMQELTRLADEAGVPVALTPSDHFGGTVGKLREFYKRFGFAPNTGRSRDLSISDAMVRQPK